MNIFGQTDIGRVRKTNQDAFAFGSLRNIAYFAVVCDGMGGENGGNIASSLAKQVIQDKLQENFREHMDSNSVRNLMLTAISAANAQIHQKAEMDSQLEGMGTTVVLVMLFDQTIHVAHVGDSRVYLVTGEKISQLTKDHSIIQHLMEQGKLTQEEAKHHPKRHQITRAVGVDAEVQVDYIDIPLEENQKLVLCTDGLSNHCDPENIQEIAMKYNAQKACEKLIKMANKRGGSDNITVVLMESDSM